MNIIKKYLQEINNKHKWIYVFILFAPFMYSMNFRNGSIKLFDDFFEFARVGSFAVIAIWFVLEKRKPSKLTLILFAMELWQLFVTCITNKKIVVAIYDLTSSLAIALLIELFLDNSDDLLKGMMLHYELAIYPNLITLLMNIGKENDSFYLGDHNIVGQFFIPAIAVACLFYRKTNNKKRCIPLIGVSLLSCFICHSTTTLFSIIISITLLLISIFVDRKGNLPIVAGFTISIIGSIFLIFIYSETVFPGIRTFMMSVFGKQMALSGRENIWPIAIEMIKEKLILGHGYRTTVTVFERFTAGHAHNAFLDKALIGGLPELLIFFVLNIALIQKTLKHKANKCKLCLASLVSYVFLTYITDSYVKFWRFYVVFFLLYHLEEVIKDKAVKNEKE